MLVKYNTAWIDGIQLRTSARLELTQVRGFLYREISKLVDYIDAKKTMSSDDIKEAVDFIITDYANYKIDEVIHIIRLMKKDSDYYERLKYPEIKKKLAQAGWPQNAINAAFKAMR